MSQASDIHTLNAILVFISLHFFIYPASNLYNSYMDRDEGSIGGLEKPPPVQKSFFGVSIFLDCIGLLLLGVADWRLLLPGLLYTLVSRAYSWQGIRIKKYAVTGWLVVSLFQGGFTYYLVHAACTDSVGSDWLNETNLVAAGIATLLIGAYYPFTQIYQHEEDIRRGDITLSSKLGVRGTFYFSAIVFAFAVLLGYTYFEELDFMIFISFLVPVLVYFLYWLIKVLKSKGYADFRHTMRFTLISSTCMSLCWITLYLLHLS